MSAGWVKLHRSCIEKGWLKNHKLWVFWTYCLMKAQHSETKSIIGYKEILLQPGQFIFGRKVAAEETGLSEQNIRTLIAALKNMKNLTIKSTNKFSIITIINWSSYQTDQPTANQQTNKQLTNNQPTTNQQLTTYKNDKNNNNILSSDNSNGKIPFQEIISYLNKRTNKNFNHTTKATQGHIRARWNEGFRIEEFFKVIDGRVAKWSTDAKYVEYLRPQTLFGTKFESYLQDAGVSANVIKEYIE